MCWFCSRWCPWCYHRPSAVAPLGIGWVIHQVIDERKEKMADKARFDHTFSRNEQKSVTPISLVFLLIFSGTFISQAAPSMEFSRKNSDWQIVTVDTVGDYGAETSLALDGAGFPHIMYWLDDGKYSYKDASGWHTTLFDDTGLDVSLVIGADNYPRVCYRNHTQIDYAYQDASGWHNVFLLGYTSSSTYTSLALDENDYPHCTFYWDEGDYANLVYYYQDAEGWDWEYVDDPLPIKHGAYNSLALDGAGYPHVSYYHSSESALRYAYRDSTGWHFETVDDEGLAGAHTSLALDGSGYPHISYFYCGTTYYPKCDAFDLRYAYQDATGWYTQTVDAAGDVGTYTSLALDSSGYPHISYRDAGQGDLKYAYQDETGWHIENVDSAGDVGEYTSLKLGKNDSVHISYNDDTNGSLKYAFLAGTTPEPDKSIFLPIMVGEPRS